MATQAESCAKKSPTTIHVNDISVDNEDDKPVEDIEEDYDEPDDEHNDATGSITSDEDADDDEVIPLEGDEEEIIGKDDDLEVVPSSPGNLGDYLVIAGAFKSEANAQAEVDRLKSVGYPNAEIVEFDFSDYYSVCVAKYNTSEDANAVANSMKSKSGKKAYVHKKRDNN
jgi:hypothetical protein